MPDLTLAELARRYGVARSTLARAVERGRQLHTTNPDLPAPPEPVNPGERQLRYPAEQMDQWWPHRPKRGRPPARTLTAPTRPSPRRQPMSHLARDMVTHTIEATAEPQLAEGARIIVPAYSVPADWAREGEVIEVKEETVVVELDGGHRQELPTDEVTLV